jgi:GT2 family glycosyltransferase
MKKRPIKQTAEDRRVQTKSSQQTAESKRLKKELLQRSLESKRLRTELSQQAANSELLRTELLELRKQIAAVHRSLGRRLAAYLKDIVTTVGIYQYLRVHIEFAREVALIKKSGLFDPSWYLAQNPDVAQSGTDPLRHYLIYGASEGRDPHPMFNGDMYLAQYPGATNSRLNPLVHYLKFGAAAGYEPHLLLGADRSSAGADTSFLAAILNEEFGNECARRVTSYSKTIATLQARIGQEPPARWEMLAAFAEQIKVLSATRIINGPVTVSIIIPAYNCIEYTIACVQSVLEHRTKHRYEIIIGNDRSTDETEKFFQAIGGLVRVTTHRLNVGFIRNCNLSAKVARGRYIVFLNNDTFVLDGWLDALIDPFVTMEGVGLVGSKLLMSNGRLQEAGGILWKDGSAWNFGRGQDPRLSEFNYLKDADYISGASIAVPRDLWNEIGGFDERFVPAYCDDSDLAFTIRSRGLRTLYQPFSVVIHHEGTSHGTDVGIGVKGYQIENTKKLFMKWQKILAAEHFEKGTKIFVARDHSAKKPHILIADHYLPEFDRDAGSRTIFQYTKMFADAGFHVTFWPENLRYSRKYAQALQAIGVEVLYGLRYKDHFENWVKENGHYMKYAFLSRAHVAKNFFHHITAHSSAKIIFYGHDLHVERLQKEFNISKNPDLNNEIAYWRQLERLSWASSDVIYYPAHEECAFVRQMYPSKTVRQIPMYFYDVSQLEDARALIARRKNNKASNLIFVGGFRHRPNQDGIIWFCTEVLPFITKAVPNILVKIVGPEPPQKVHSLQGPNIQVTGFVSEEQLVSLYQSSSVAIAPLRFGGGVKGKIIEAIRYGLPVVTTTVGQHGIDGGEAFLKVADEPEAFAQAIIELLADANLRLRLASRGVDFLAEHYSQKAARNLLACDVPELSIA